MQAPMPPLIFTFHHDPSQLSSSSLEMTVIHGEAPDDEDEGYEKNNNKIQEQNQHDLYRRRYFIFTVFMVL